MEAAGKPNVWGQSKISRPIVFTLTPIIFASFPVLVVTDSSRHTYTPFREVSRVEQYVTTEFLRCAERRQWRHDLNGMAAGTRF